MRKKILHKKSQVLQRLLDQISNVMYLVFGIIMALISASILTVGLYQVIMCIMEGCDIVSQLLNMASLVIIAVAIFDVAKYLIEEEVFRDRELRSAEEARKSLTKFMVIIVIAVTLEALISIIKTSTSDISNMVYPIALFVAAVSLLVGLGVYQRFSAITETEIE